MCSYHTSPLNFKNIRTVGEVWVREEGSQRLLTTDGVILDMSVGGGSVSAPQMSFCREFLSMLSAERVNLRNLPKLFVYSADKLLPMLQRQHSPPTDGDLWRLPPHLALLDLNFRNILSADFHSPSFCYIIDNSKKKFENDLYCSNIIWISIYVCTYFLFSWQ